MQPRKTERKRSLPVLPLMEKTKIKKNFNSYKDIKNALSSSARRQFNLQRI